MPQEKNYASAKNPSIAAAIDGLFKFQNRAQAEERLMEIKNSFIISKKESGIDDVVLWIKDFTTAEERGQNYNGNYAKISVAKQEGGFTLVTEKIAKDKNFHPKRIREKRPHPNWGHPILRGIKNAKVYKSVEAAQEAMDKLHEEFPNSTIPARTKLYVMIFSRETKPPVQKWVLEQKLQPDGSIIIEFAPNTYTRKPTEKPAETEGYFTSMVKMRKKRK